MFHIHRVLVLDDDEVMRELIEALLSLEGYDVTTVSSGEEALQILGADPAFDLILTDLHMPVLEGTDLAAALKAAKPAHTLLLGMSGSELPPGTEAYLDAFLPKPFDTRSFEAAVDAAQKRRALAATPEETSGGSESTAVPFPSLDTSDTSSVVLDEGIFQRLVNVIPLPQLMQLYEMTLTDIIKRYGRIEAAETSGDLDTVHSEAHAIKGSCGMVGAVELQHLASQIENASSVNTTAVREIPRACLRLRRMLNTKLQTA